MGPSHSKQKHNNTEDIDNSTMNEDIRLPHLDIESKLIKPDQLKQIIRYLPNDTYKENWKLLFSSSRDGHSFNRFQTHISEKGSVIIFVKEEGKEGQVFGGFCDEHFKLKYPKFYGNKNNFTFRLEPKLEVFQSTGLDKNFQYLNSNSMTLFNGFAMGGELLYSWSIDSTFEKGESKGSDEFFSDQYGDGLPRSSTYGNTTFGSNPHGDYKVEYVEAYLTKELKLSEEDLLEIEYNNRTKKGGKPSASVLKDDDNADKVIKGMMGNHEFTNYHEDIVDPKNNNNKKS